MKYGNPYLKKKAVVAVISVFHSWLRSGYVEATGEIHNPLPSDLTGTNIYPMHAICLAGFDDNDQSFVFKNSWGKTWAKTFQV